MTFRSILIALFALAAWLGACAGGSELDDYSEGVPGVVPSPVGSSADAGSGSDGGSGDRDGGGAGGGGGGGEGAIGSACDQDDDCSDGPATCQDDVSLLGFITYDLQGGYCTVTGCQSNEQCPADSGCFAITGNCLKKCESNAQCRGSEGYECGTLDTTQKYCVPGQVLDDIGSLLNIAGGLLGGTGGAAGGTGGLIGGLFGSLLGGGGTGGPGGAGN